MLCGCTSRPSTKSDIDDSGVYTGGEDAEPIIPAKKKPSPSQKRIARARPDTQLAADQAYPGCFAGFGGAGLCGGNRGRYRSRDSLYRSKDDLDIYSGGSHTSVAKTQNGGRVDKYGLITPTTTMETAHLITNQENIPTPTPIRKSPSIPILELHEPTCSLYSQETMVRNSRMYQPYKGQIQLGVYINSGLLTVHVMSARQLSNTYGTDCNSYVKLAFTPDDTKRTKCKTSIIKNTNTPEFDEKFSFELLEGDTKKRLQISMWHKESNQTPSELLGCMSFGVKHVLHQKTVVDGWYFLLSDAIGRRKHLQVSAAHASTHTSTTEEGSEDKTHSSKGLTSDSPILTTEEEETDFVATITLQRGLTGFGFQVTGDRPAHILRIQEGSVSARAGLRQGDFILQINTSDVSDLSADTVARILRQCPGEVQLTYERHHRKPPDILQGIQPAPDLQPGKPLPPSEYINMAQVKPPGSPVKERRATSKTLSGSNSEDGVYVNFGGAPSPVVERAGILKPTGSTRAVGIEKRVQLPAQVSGREDVNTTLSSTTDSPLMSSRNLEPHVSPIIGRQHQYKPSVTSPVPGMQEVASNSVVMPADTTREVAQMLPAQAYTHGEVAPNQTIPQSVMPNMGGNRNGYLPPSVSSDLARGIPSRGIQSQLNNHEPEYVNTKQIIHNGANIEMNKQVLSNNINHEAKYMHADYVSSNTSGPYSGHHTYRDTSGSQPNVNPGPYPRGNTDTGVHMQQQTAGFSNLQLYDNHPRVAGGEYPAASYNPHAGSSTATGYNPQSSQYPDAAANYNTQGGFNTAPSYNGGSNPSYNRQGFANVVPSYNVSGQNSTPNYNSKSDLNAVSNFNPQVSTNPVQQSGFNPGSSYNAQSSSNPASGYTIQSGSISSHAIQGVSVMPQTSGQNVQGGLPSTSQTPTNHDTFHNPHIQPPYTSQSSQYNQVTIPPYPKDTPLSPPRDSSRKPLPPPPPPPPPKSPPSYTHHAASPLQQRLPPAEPPRPYTGMKAAFTQQRRMILPNKLSLEQYSTPTNSQSSSQGYQQQVGSHGSYNVNSAVVSGKQQIYAGSARYPSDQGQHNAVSYSNVSYQQSSNNEYSNGQVGRSFTNQDSNKQIGNNIMGQNSFGPIGSSVTGSNGPIRGPVTSHQPMRYKNSTCESEETSSDGDCDVDTSNPYYIHSLVAREANLKNAQFLRSGNGGLNGSTAVSNSVPSQPHVTSF